MLSAERTGMYLMRAMDVVPSTLDIFPLDNIPENKKFK